MNNALKSHADIVAEMESGPIPEHRHDREILRYYARSLDLAHKREIDALDQRCTELNAEIAAKDAVIMRLNDAIAEEQRRQMATTEKSSVVGDAAKLPKTVDLRFDICQNIELVLKIGRDYQNKDGYRGAHYDTVKLLCDAIEYQQEQLKTKTEVGNAAKLYEAVRKLRARFYNNEVAYQQRYFAYSDWHWHKKAKEAEKWRVIFSDYRAECDDALGRPARICDKMDRHKAIRDCRVWLKRYGHKLTSRQDDVMMQTIYWLYDETKEAEARP